MRALIVVPTFNEAENITALVIAIHAVAPAVDVLVVDDGSPDGTARRVAAMAAADGRVHLLERPGKAGLGSAYVAGFAWGLLRQYQWFFEMDADFSHDPRFLPAFMAAFGEGADVVVGSRAVRGGAIVGWGPLRHLLSRGGSFYARWLLSAPVRDMTTGFKAYTRHALQTIDLSSLRSNGYAFQVETTHRALRRGLRIVEVPIVFVDRRVGQSKMSLREVLEAIGTVWRLSWERKGRRASARPEPE